MARPISLVAFLFLAGCASRPPMMYTDNFFATKIGGVEIVYPVGGNEEHVANGVFRYEMANIKIVVRRRRLYANGKFVRALHKGDELKICGGDTVLLNDHQLFP